MRSLEELKSKLMPEEELEDILRMLQKRLKEQQEEHNGGSYWVGTQGRSVFGNSGWRRGAVRVDGTVRDTCDQAGMLRIRYRKARKNALKVLLLMDSGGSMEPYAALCAQLFQAVEKANHFQELHTYYFHNCVYGNLYEDPQLRSGHSVLTEWALKNYDGA